MVLGKYLGHVGHAVPVVGAKVLPLGGHLPAVKFPSKVVVKSLDGPLHHPW